MMPFSYLRFQFFFALLQQIVEIQILAGEEVPHQKAELHDNDWYEWEQIGIFDDLVYQKSGSGRRRLSPLQKHRQAIRYLEDPEVVFEGAETAKHSKDYFFEPKTFDGITLEKSEADADFPIDFDLGGGDKSEHEGANREEATREDEKSSTPKKETESLALHSKKEIVSKVTSTAKDLLHSSCYCGHKFLLSAFEERRNRNDTWVHHDLGKYGRFCIAGQDPSLGAPLLTFNYLFEGSCPADMVANAIFCASLDWGEHSLLKSSFYESAVDYLQIAGLECYAQTPYAARYGVSAEEIVGNLEYYSFSVVSMFYDKAAFIYYQWKRKILLDVMGMNTTQNDDNMGEKQEVTTGNPLVNTELNPGIWAMNPAVWEDDIHFIKWSAGTSTIRDLGDGQMIRGWSAEIDPVTNFRALNTCPGPEDVVLLFPEHVSRGSAEYDFNPLHYIPDELEKDDDSMGDGWISDQIQKPWMQKKWNSEAEMSESSTKSDLSNVNILSQDLQTRLKRLHAILQKQVDGRNLISSLQFYLQKNVKKILPKAISVAEKILLSSEKIPRRLLTESNDWKAQGNFVLLVLRLIEEHVAEGKDGKNQGGKSGTTSSPLKNLDESEEEDEDFLTKKVVLQTFEDEEEFFFNNNGARSFSVRNGVAKKKVQESLEKWYKMMPVNSSGGSNSATSDMKSNDKANDSKSLETLVSFIEWSISNYVNNFQLHTVPNASTEPETQSEPTHHALQSSGFVPLVCALPMVWPAEMDYRAAIKRTWGKTNQVSDLTCNELYFFVALPDDYCDSVCFEHNDAVDKSLMERRKNSKKVISEDAHPKWGDALEDVTYADYEEFYLTIASPSPLGFSEWNETTIDSDFDKLDLKLVRHEEMALLLKHHITEEEAIKKEELLRGLMISSDLNTGGKLSSDDGASNTNRGGKNSGSTKDSMRDNTMDPDIFQKSYPRHLCYKKYLGMSEKRNDYCLPDDIIDLRQKYPRIAWDLMTNSYRHGDVDTIKEKIKTTGTRNTIAKILHMLLYIEYENGLAIELESKWRRNGLLVTQLNQLDRLKELHIEKSDDTIRFALQDLTKNNYSAIMSKLVYHRSIVDVDRHHKYWVCRLERDTYFLPENFRLLARTLNVSQHYNLGTPQFYELWNGRRVWNDGGPGICMSGGALKRYSLHLRKIEAFYMAAESVNDIPKYPDEYNYLNGDRSKPLRETHPDGGRLIPDPYTYSVVMNTTLEEAELVYRPQFDIELCQSYLRGHREDIMLTACFSEVQIYPNLVDTRDEFGRDKFIIVPRFGYEKQRLEVGNPIKAWVEREGRAWNYLKGRTAQYLHCSGYVDRMPALMFHNFPISFNSFKAVTWFDSMYREIHRIKIEDMSV